MMCTLYNDDCLKIMKTMDDNSVDCIITDPPYGINYTKWDNNFPIKLAIKECARLIKPNGNIIIFQGWSNVNNTISIIESCTNWKLEDWIIYDRIKGRGGKKHLVSTREDILWYSNGSNYTFNKIPSTIKKKTGGLGLKNGCEFRALSNVWTDISPIVPWSKEKVNHPTQKPIQLMERCVKLWSNENDTILDFTMGSGTTGVAALKNNRNFIGIDENKEYFDISINRLKNIKSEYDFIVHGCTVQ